jgi:N-acetyl sugar amidotransferase
MMLRCSRCVMPNTRPDTPFVDGVCAACLSYARRPAIDWQARKAELVALLDRHDGRCIVPSSGGKDSTYQVMTLLELGADVTVVTARTCHLTPLGRANIDNLTRHARTIEVVPNMKVRAKLNRLGLQLVGDISWPEHCAIFTTPFNVAADLGIPLIFYGENPQDQYGGPLGSEDAKVMTRRWVSEFGGFLGLRPDDFVGKEGITERDMQDYQLTDKARSFAFEANFLGQYVPWDSRRNAEVAQRAGMQTFGFPPCEANWWNAENLDNAQTGLHDYFMWLKYGFGRGCQQISVDVREGNVKREHALAWVEEHDGLKPMHYCGVPRVDVLDAIGVTPAELARIAEGFTDRSIHAG